MVELRIGDIISGYKLLAQIGQGGMGIVFLAEHLALNRICALKFLAPSLVSKTSWMMFQNEVKLVSGLSHPTICRIYDMGIYEGKLPFYSMDYLIGETLDSVLMREGTLSLGAAVEVFSKVADGLSYAHSQGIVHKDIKPANIMLLPDSSGNVGVNILDFGIAELVDQDTHSAKRSEAGVVGSAYYMSPEQFKGTRLDHRSDIYNLGCSLFETLTGEPPYVGVTREELSVQHITWPIPRITEMIESSQDFPQELDAIVSKALAKSADERYQDARTLIDDFNLLLEKHRLEPDLSEEDSIQSDVPQEKEPTRTSTKRALFQALLVSTFACVVIIMSLRLPAFFQKELYSNLDNGAKPSNKQKMKSKETDINEDSFEHGAGIESWEPRVKDAVARVADHVERNVHSARSCISRGKALSEVDEAEGAIRELNKGLSARPDLWTVKISDCLVKSYVASGRLDHALSEINRGLGVSQTVERYRKRGEIQQELLMFEEALISFDNALRLAPNDYWTYYHRGGCYGALRHYDKALEDFSRCIVLQPGVPQGYEARAKVFSQIGKKDLAERDLEESRRLTHR